MSGIDEQYMERDIPRLVGIDGDWICGDPFDHYVIFSSTERKAIGKIYKPIEVMYGYICCVDLNNGYSIKDIDGIYCPNCSTMMRNSASMSRDGFFSFIGMVINGGGKMLFRKEN